MCPDFGQTKLVAAGRLEERRSSLMMTADCGTIQWMAPELCANADAIKQKWHETRDLADSHDVIPTSRLQSYGRFRETHSMIECTHKVDVYSFGIVLHELLMHEAPWSELIRDEAAEDCVWAQTRDHMMHLVAQGNRPRVSAVDRARAPEGWCTLMEQCQSQLPESRPSFLDIVACLEKIRVQVIQMNSAAFSSRAGSRMREAEAPLLHNPTNCSTRASSPTFGESIPLVSGHNMSGSGDDPSVKMFKTRPHSK